MDGDLSTSFPLLHSIPGLILPVADPEAYYLQTVVALPRSAVRTPCQATLSLDDGVCQARPATVENVLCFVAFAVVRGDVGARGFHLCLVVTWILLVDTFEALNRLSWNGTDCEKSCSAVVEASFAVPCNGNLCKHGEHEGSHGDLHDRLLRLTRKVGREEGSGWCRRLRR